MFLGCARCRRELKHGGALTFHEARKIVLDRFEEAYLPRVLARADGVVARAAELAGVARPSFYRMLERLRASGRGGG